jgi:hypothetical protein
MGSDARHPSANEVRIDLLRKLERIAAVEEPASLALLVAIRELVIEAEAEIDD